MKLIDIVILFLSSILGFLSFLIPAILGGNYIEVIQGETVTSSISLLYENMSFVPTIALLFCTGYLLAMWRPRLWLIIGLLSIVVFPINSIVEMINDPSSHNLWPIEFIFYGFLAIPAILGACIRKNHNLESMETDSEDSEGTPPNNQD